MSNVERFVGQPRSRKQKYDCGICGVKKRLTKSHVPPQCAGNAGLVSRSHLLINGNEVSQGRRDRGGIHFRGLCDDCNSSAGRYDGAYGEFAGVMRQVWVKDWTLELPPLIALPDVVLKPGAVVRSILLGMTAATSVLRRNWPTLPEALLDGVPMPLPDGLRLRLALARGVSARVAGTMAGFHLNGPLARRDGEDEPVGINAVASVYFPPLAWELVHSGSTLLDEYGWADVSGWTEFEPDTVVRLHDLLRALPATAHPWHHPHLNRHWLEMTDSKQSQVIECTNVEGGERRGRGAPDTVDHRASLSIAELNELRGR